MVGVAKDTTNWSRMDYSTIILTYNDLLDIIRDYSLDKWECYPCTPESFAKYVWEQYREPINPLEEIE